MSGAHVLLARALRDAVAEVWGKPLTMNVAMPIAAVLLDLGYPARVVKAIPILARTAGLLAHLAEEQERPSASSWRGAEEAIEYEPEPAVILARGRDPPWKSSSPSTTRAIAPNSPTCSSARRSTGRSSAGALRRSRRARRDRGAAAHGQARAAGDVQARQPDRRAPLRGAVRDRPDLLDERNDRRAQLRPADRRRPRQLGDGSARSYAASGITAGQRIVSTYNAGPFVAGAALASFERIGLCHIPVGTGNTERLMRAVERSPARGRGAHAVVRRVPSSGRQNVELDLRIERRARPRGR